jgi:hypothetical protein
MIFSERTPRRASNYQERLVFPLYKLSAFCARWHIKGSNTMNRSTTLALATFALLSFVLTGNAFAQQKEQASFKATPENSKITQGMNIDVGDAPNHIIRIFEVHRAYPSNAAVIAGLKLVEEWNRGFTEFTAGYGSANTHIIYVMENGDKMFARSVNVIEPASGKFTTKGVGTITGGTGKLAGAQGVVRLTTTFDPKTGYNDGQTEIEYWLGK